jgi:hypothetical protein
MANLVYTRVSTDEQSTQRQTHLLTEAGLTAVGSPTAARPRPPLWSLVDALPAQVVPQVG